MKLWKLVILLLLVPGGAVTAQHTFSIVAIDTMTGEIGSAGATCLDGSFGGGAVIISDILPGKGAIHTQAFWNPANQQNARARMEAGDDANQIINWLVANDAQGNPAIRQYGVVAIDQSGTVTSEGYTGVSTNDYKNHVVGPTYAIQGNILLGQQILDSMESRFVNTTGSLAERLMASMQGANVPGADTRCLSSGVSSFTSFLRVSRSSDFGGAYYRDHQINSTPANGVDPIDALQALFDAWSPPDCDISIPTTSTPILVQDTTLSTSSSQKIYLVCAGDSLILSSSIENQVYLLGPGAYCSIGSFSASNSVFLADSTILDGTGSIGTTINADPGATVLAEGAGAFITLCDSLTYLNLGDFPGICQSPSTSVREDLLRSIQIDSSVRGKIRLRTSYPGQVAELTLITLTGNEIARFYPDSNLEQELPYAPLSSGLYILTVMTDRGESLSRKVILP